MHHSLQLKLDAPLPRSLFDTWVELDRLLYGATDGGRPAFALRVVGLGFGLTAIGQCQPAPRSADCGTAWLSAAHTPPIPDYLASFLQRYL
jgi:hypothetical protein